MNARTRSLLAVTAAACAAGALTGAATAPRTSGPRTEYQHIFVIVEENHGYTDVIGNPAAPNLNALAAQYGIATNYDAVAHPSEPNYVALLGGSTFTVNSDNAYYVQRVAAPSLISELDHAHVSWKAYLQGVPHAGYQGICYPASCNGSPDKDPLYVSKHDAIQNFTSSLNPADWSRQVPSGQLQADLNTGHLPSFGWIIPTECDDQHGDPPYCLDSGNPGGSDPQDQRLVAVGDNYLGQLVSEITHASFWAKGNNAIDVVYDEGDDNAGGGGRVANVVITSHGPRHLQDPAAYSHYSLLRTVQDNFGVACLQHSCDAATQPMTPLFAVTGSPALPYTALAAPLAAAPSPVPAEPVSYTADSASGGGWATQPAPALGTGGNTLGGVAAVSPHDVWAVGNYLPDAAGSNTDATLATAAHFDGTSWTQTPVPHAGTNFNTLFGVAATPGRAWAVGAELDASYQPRALIDTWDGSSWHLAATPALGGQGSTLYSAVALSPANAWAAGLRQDGQGVFHTLIEHWDGAAWSVIPSPDPGASGNVLYGITAAGPHDIWAVGQRDGLASDQPLMEHWDGSRWSVVEVPSGGAADGVLQGVAAGDGQVWAVGQTDDAADQARPLIEHWDAHGWTAQRPAGVRSGFSDINGVAVAGHTAWLAGSALDHASGTQVTVLAKDSGGGWQRVAAPNPGSGDRVLGGVSATGGKAWAVGYYTPAGAHSPLVEVDTSAGAR